MDLKEAKLLGDDAAGHWYYVAKSRALRALLGPHPVGTILDVGAGTGVFSRQLLDVGLAETATCVDTGYEHNWSETQSGRPIHFVRSTKDVSADLVLMMDVLEHVADDTALLREYTQTMPAAGRIVITVPAFQFLWSGHDVFLEHHRRYTLTEVEALVRRAGLKPIKSCYFFASLFPAVALLRILHRVRSGFRSPAARDELKRYPKWLNATLIGIHGLERLSYFRLNRVAGLTIFCLAQR